MDQLNSFVSSVLSRYSKNRFANQILTLLAYVLPVSLFFLILYQVSVPVSVLLMVARISIFIFIIDLPLLWALQRSHKLSIFFTLLIFAAVFSLALKLVWQNEGDLYINQGSYSSIGGLLPWSDASGYFANARTFLNGGLIPAYAATSSRVFFVSTISTLLGITGQNLQLTIALICLACMFSCYFLIREVKQSFGLFPAFVGFILLFSFFLINVGALLSEMEGFALGGIGCALLINGTREKKNFPLWLGLFMLALAVNARPGAFFIFPALLLWSVFYRNDSFYNKRFWFGCLIAIGIGFLINWLFTQWLAVKISSNYSNFPVLLLSLVSGGINPDSLVRQHPELNIITNNQFAVQIAYQMALDTFRNNPAELLVGISKSYLDYFGTRGTFIFIAAENRPVTLICDGLFIIGIITGLLSLKRAEKNIWGMAGLGILLTVPIINYVGVRVYAATIPIQVILICLAIQTILSWFKIDPRIDKIEPENFAKHSIRYSAIILVIIILGPIALRLFSKPVETKLVTCPDSQVSATILWTQGSYIQLVPDYQIATSSAPLVRISDFKRGMLGYDNTAFYNEMKKMQENHYLMNAYDLTNGSTFWLVLDQSQIHPLNRIIGVCGKYRSTTLPGSFGVMDAISVTSLQ